MTDADAEAMLAECRAVLPGLKWRMVGPLYAMGSDAGATIRASANGHGPPGPQGHMVRAACFVVGGAEWNDSATVRDALSKARDGAVARLNRMQDESDRDRAWLGLSNG
jgi:hypothetical protein